MKRLVAWASAKGSPARGKAGSGKKGTSTMAVGITVETVRTLVRFQEQGEKRDLESVWIAIESHVEKTARTWLVNHFVTGPGGLVDTAAMADVKQLVVRKLAELPHKPAPKVDFDAFELREIVAECLAELDLAAVDEVVQRVRTAIFEGAGPGGKGQFNPSLGRGGVDGLRAWLFRIVQTQTASHCREYRADGRRKIKRSTFTDLELNDRAGVDSVLRAPLKVDPDRFELVEIVNDCVRSLSQPLQKLYRVRFVEGLSHREAAKRLHVTAPTVCRHEARLRHAVDRWFRDRGIDGAGLIA